MPLSQADFWGERGVCSSLREFGSSSVRITVLCACFQPAFSLVSNVLVVVGHAAGNENMSDFAMKFEANGIVEKNVIE